MKKIFLIIGVLFLTASCKKEAKKEENTKAKTEVKVDVSEVKVETLTYEELEPLLNLKNDKTYVINFWATWCTPCIKELPAFEKLNSEYKDKNVEVILVSIDFPKQLEKRLKPYIKKKNLQSKVILLNVDKENAWVKKIDENWGGAIPATLIYNKSQKKFYPQTFNYTELVNELQSFIN